MLKYVDAQLSNSSSKYRNILLQDGSYMNLHLFETIFTELNGYLSAANATLSNPGRSTLEERWGQNTSTKEYLYKNFARLYNEVDTLI